MNAKWTKRLLTAALVAIVAGGFIYALMPRPVPVDTATLDFGEMRVTVDEEGKTRIRDVYVVSAPVGGKVRRSPREAGDLVVANETVVAVLQPSDPPFLDLRTRRDLEAAVEAARAALALAATEVRKASTELKFAENDFERAKSLSRTNIISERAMEQSSLQVDVRRDALAAAEANLELRRRELESAQARLIGPEHLVTTAANGQCCVEVRAPVDGRVLKIVTKSEQVVPAGAPLIEIGDPRNLEIVVELLSADAVKVNEGDEATVENWGGDRILKARVRRIEPSGFTKVSALGIEEQRVRVILDLIDPPEAWSELGHDFRVFVRITIWQSDSVLRVPLSALFRTGAEWSVFRVDNGVARQVPVRIGRRNSEMAEVTAGLEKGDVVVLHPSDRIADGIGIEERE